MVRILLLLVLLSAVQGTGAATLCTLRVNDEEKKTGLSCYYDGPGMTVAWTDFNDDTFDSIQVEYQCFNESLESISEVDQENNIVAVAIDFIVLEKKAVVNKTNSTCFVTGCVDTLGRNPSIFWMEQVICSPLNAPDLIASTSVAVTSSVAGPSSIAVPNDVTLLSSVVVTSSIAITSSSVMTNNVLVTSTSSSYSTSTASPSSTALLGPMEYIIAIIVLACFAMLLFVSIFAAIGLCLLWKRRKRKRMDEAQVVELKDTSMKAFPFPARDENAPVIVTQWNTLESIGVSRYVSPSKVAIVTPIRKEIDQHSSFEDFCIKPSKNVQLKVVTKEDPKEYICSDFENSGCENKADYGNQTVISLSVTGGDNSFDQGYVNPESMTKPDYLDAELL